MSSKHFKLYRNQAIFFVDFILLKLMEKMSEFNSRVLSADK